IISFSVRVFPLKFSFQILSFFRTKASAGISNFFRRSLISLSEGGFFKYSIIWNPLPIPLKFLILPGICCSEGYGRFSFYKVFKKFASNFFVLSSSNRLSKTGRFLRSLRHPHFRFLLRFSHLSPVCMGALHNFEFVNPIRFFSFRLRFLRAAPSFFDALFHTIEI